ncbi:hypothetical protein ACFQV4_06095 [Streptomyces thermocarboxydus]
MCGALLSLPGDGWGADGPAAPPYARNAASQAALDPAKLTRAPASAWQTSARTDFSVWPARGRSPATGRCCAARSPCGRGRVRASRRRRPRAPSGGPAGPPQLLYAGTVDAARVVILYDGWRLARYAEPEQGERGAVLDLARVDGAGRAGASAVVLSRSDGNVRFLLAPWVREAGERDLRDPDEGAKELPLQDGVTGPFLSGQGREPCTAWNALELTDGTDTRLFTDLGELVPARLTTGRPGEAKDVSGAKARHLWEPYACSLAVMRSAGVRSVNAWAYAEQPLPGTDEEAEWLCTRGETWRGTGARVLAQFRSPGARYGAVAARAENVPACGKRQPDVLAGVLWKSADGTWHLLAVSSDGVTSVEATGDVEGKAKDRMLSVRAEKGARADLKGTLEDGGRSAGCGDPGNTGAAPARGRPESIGKVFV